MKKTLLILLTFLFSITLFCQIENGPIISITKREYDFGQINYGDPCVCCFEIKNTGNQPLYLYKCKGSCGCTIPKCETSPILPEQTYNIEVRYDSKRVGPIHKSVTVYSNAINEPYLLMKLQGEILENPKFINK